MYLRADVTVTKQDELTLNSPLGVPKKGTYLGHKLSEKKKFPIDWHQFSIFLTTLRAVDDAFCITIQWRFGLLKGK